MKKSITYGQSMFIFLFILATSACSAVSKELEKDNTAMQNSAIEVIYGFDVKEESLWFLVKSNGCTSEKNFNLQIDRLNEETAEVTLYRKKRDLCRGLPKLISINIAINNSTLVNTMTSTKSSRYIVNNPFERKPERAKR